MWAGPQATWREEVILELWRRFRFSGGVAEKMILSRQLGGCKPLSNDETDYSPFGKILFKGFRAQISSFTASGLTTLLLYYPVLCPELLSVFQHSGGPF